MSNRMAVLPLIQWCPVCGGEPEIGETEPWPAGNGPAPWYASCYRVIPFEHFVGVNGDTRLATVQAWNTEVSKIEAMKPRHRGFDCNNTPSPDGRDPSPF